MHAMIDRLEGRQLLSFTVSNASTGLTVRPANEYAYTTTTSQPANSVVTTLKVSKTGTLFVSGTGKADTLNIQVKNGKLVNSTNFFTMVTKGSDTIYSVGLNVSGKIKRVDVSGLGGNDAITVIADVPVNVRGAAGDDTLNVFAPQRTIGGGSGNDTIREGNEAAGDAYRPNTFRVIGPLGSSQFAFRDRESLTISTIPGASGVQLVPSTYKPTFVTPVTADDTKKPGRTSPER